MLLCSGSPGLALKSILIATFMRTSKAYSIALVGVIHLAEACACAAATTTATATTTAHEGMIRQLTCESRRFRSEQNLQGTDQ